MLARAFILGSVLVLGGTSVVLAQSAYSTGTAASTEAALGTGSAYAGYVPSEAYGGHLYAYAPKYGHTIKRRWR